MGGPGGGPGGRGQKSFKRIFTYMDDPLSEIVKANLPRLKIFQPVNSDIFCDRSKQSSEQMEAYFPNSNDN